MTYLNGSKITAKRHNLVEFALSDCFLQGWPKNRPLFTARPTALLAVPALYMSARRPAVCLSVTFRCFVEMNEATIMRFSLSGSTIILVSGE